MWRSTPASDDDFLVFRRRFMAYAPKVQRSAAVLWLVCGIAASAHAQSVNVNFGDPANPPSSTYAAAGAAGVWNSVTGVNGMVFPLVLTDGTTSGITVSQQPTTTLLTGSDPSVTGDDATLLDTGLVTTGNETCVAFSGFPAGTYEVLVYAWTPDQPTVKSRTRQDAAPSTIDVGGAWTGSHVEGVTYARYVVAIGPDSQLPAHSGLVPGQLSAALNGIQIRPLSEVGTDAGVPGDAAGGGGGGGGGAPSDGGGDLEPHHAGCSTGGGGSGAVVMLALVLLRRRRAR
jgi:uncharacterized protein (TIGR03382 family)